VALEKPEIWRNDPNIPIENNCLDDELHVGIPGGSGDYEEEGEESNYRNAIRNHSRWWLPVTELERFNLGTSDADWDQGKVGDDGDANVEAQGSQANDGSTQNVEEWGHSRCDIGTRDVDGYEGEDGNDAHNEEEE
jgi:hypothetical protein